MGPEEPGYHGRSARRSAIHSDGEPRSNGSPEHGAILVPMTPMESHFAARVNVPADKVIHELRERLARRWEPDRCERLDDGVAVQGGWWYRGEYHVTPTADGGSRVVHDVINVAPASTRWLVPITVRSRPEEHRRGFMELLRTIGEVREDG